MVLFLILRRLLCFARLCLYCRPCVRDFRDISSIFVDFLLTFAIDAFGLLAYSWDKGFGVKGSHYRGTGVKSRRFQLFSLVMRCSINDIFTCLLTYLH